MLSFLQTNPNSTSDSSANLTPSKLGWGFLLAWVFCIFYLGTIDCRFLIEPTPSNESLPFLTQLIVSGLPVFASIATIGYAIAIEPRMGELVDHPRMRIASPLIASIGTVVYFLPLPNNTWALPVFITASMATGIGSGFMWLLWGSFYSRIPQDHTEVLAPASAAIAALLALASSAMSGWIGVVFVASFPIISGMSLEWALKNTPQKQGNRNEHGQPSAAHALRSMGRTVLGIFVACVFVCLSGSFLDADPSVRPETPVNQVSVLVALVFTMALTTVAVVGPRRISISFFYRWMCPALVLGFASVILLPEPFGSIVAFVTSISARFAFCLITQMFFARFAESGKATATKSFGWGWVGVHLGDFIGVLLLLLLQNFPTIGMGGPEDIAAACIVVLVFATMFVLDDGTSFRTQNSDTEDAFSTVVPSKRSRESKTACPKDGAGSRADHNDGVRTERHAPSRDTEEPLTDKREPAASDTPFEEVILSISKASRLTPRETEVFALLARGRSIPYIRDELVISRETAATHAKHIYAKLDVHSRQELIDLVAKH